MDFGPLDPKIEIVFKMLLAEEDSEPILIALLNSIIRSPHPITKTKVLNLQIPKRYIDDKGTILDILAELDSGEQVNVEMQMANQGDTRSWALYQWARIYGSQLKRGKVNSYRTLKPVYSVFFINYSEFKDLEPRLHHTLQLTHAHHPYVTLSDLRLHFIELSSAFLVNLQESLEQNKLALWAKFLLNPSDRSCWEELMADPDITKAREKLPKISADAEKRELARMREKAALDWNSSHEYAREQGREEGREEGRHEAQRNILKNLLSTIDPRQFSL